MMMFWLAFIGFIALTALSFFYVPRCCALAFAIYILGFSGLYVTTKTYEAIIIAVVLLILIAMVIWFDFKNLRLNPFSKK